MKRSKLRYIYLHERTKEAKRQRNPCVGILRKNKKDCFGNLNNKIVTDNRNFWKATIPLFSKKTFHKECIILKESNKIIKNNEELAETFNTFFRK